MPQVKMVPESYLKNCEICGLATALEDHNICIFCAEDFVEPIEPFNWGN